MSSCHSSKSQHNYTQDVDCGWAYVVALSAFLCHFTTGGFGYTTGVFYVEFLEVFKESKGTTAWVSSLVYGVLCASGPVGSFLIGHIGCRRVLLLGTFVSSTGMFVTAFAHKIYVVFLTLGVMTGFGFGVIFTAGIVMVSYHFNRYRTLAMGLTIAGGSMGTIVYPWISRVLIQTYAWRGALIICSGINLHLAVIAMLVPMKSPLEQTVSKKLDTYENKPTWKQTLHLDLFKSLIFHLLAMNGLFFNFGLFVMYTHISAYALSLNLGQNIADLLISLLGISGLLGRIGLGALGQLQWVNVPILFATSYAIAGLATCVCGLLKTAIGLSASVFICGLFAAAYGPLLAEVTFVTMGPVKFSQAYGYMMAYQGVGTILGPPVAGWLYDFTQIYPASFFLGSSAMILSSVIVIPHLCFSRQYWKTHENVEVVVIGNEQEPNEPLTL